LYLAHLIKPLGDSSGAENKVGSGGASEEKKGFIAPLNIEQINKSNR
jgi:hypothetical protein